MNDVVLRIVAAVVSACFFCVSTLKMLGAMQQAGYKNGEFMGWIARKDNQLFNRFGYLAVALAFTPAIVSLCFSFLGKRSALLLSALPFFLMLVLYAVADSKYALKVPVNKTGRFWRLFAVYILLVASFGYLFIALLKFLAEWNGSALYGLIAYVPFALMPLFLPLFLCLANAITGIFENANNAKFVKRAGQVLDETQIIRIGVVGSYGKTSVKNILKTILEEKFTVVATPESYNTPIGIAKTVTGEEFKDKQIFIAEMGARKQGDIAELCTLVKPDYAVFTGVCEQHIKTFCSLENVWTEKSEILKCGAKKVVCGEGLEERIQAEFAGAENVVTVNAACLKDVQYFATHTSFILCLGEEEIAVDTKLLGEAAVENILLAATLCKELGMTAEEIGGGIAKLQAIPHRLQLLENNGVYILDDGYNSNPIGAQRALDALARFNGRKCVVTPGIVECGVLEEEKNGELGAQIAALGLDKVMLVGDTLVGAVKSGYEKANGDMQKLSVHKTLADAQTALAEWLGAGDAILFLNDLPDVY